MKSGCNLVLKSLWLQASPAGVLSSSTPPPPSFLCLMSTAHFYFIFSGTLCAASFYAHFPVPPPSILSLTSLLFLISQLPWDLIFESHQWFPSSKTQWLLFSSVPIFILRHNLCCQFSSVFPDSLKGTYKLMCVKMHGVFYGFSYKPHCWLSCNYCFVICFFT